jgi:hypothetical protein
VLGVFPGARSTVAEECRHLLIGMSWLPALGFAVAAYALVRFVRGEGPPLSRSWAVDLALIAAAAALGLRAYDAFTTETSYAPYYAAPLVLLLALLHQRVGERWPSARPAALAALAAVALGLGAYALVALYPDQNTAVHTARGTFMTNAPAARALQPTLDFVRRSTSAGQPILALPADAGVYFMSDRRPALYDLMFLPGLLDSVADERSAVARLRREDVRLAVVGRHRFTGYSARWFGVDYNRLLAAYIRRDGPPMARFGGAAPAQSGTNPARAYSVYRLGP